MRASRSVAGTGAITNRPQDSILPHNFKDTYCAAVAQDGLENCLFFAKSGRFIEFPGGHQLAAAGHVLAVEAGFIAVE